MNMAENKPHTYLARMVTQPVSPTTGSIRVYNIDEGMTPVYGVFESNQEKMKYIPVGLRVPDQLLENHQSGDLIDEKDLWTLNESYLELNHPLFTTHPELALNEVPEQYKIKGPGQITLGELAQDDPAVEHTSADDFRKDPTQFSWLKMDQPENITNPLEGSNPPPDGLYRVQHETYMTMTLGEHFRRMLNLEAEPPSGARPFTSKSTEHYLSGLRTAFNKPNVEFIKWGAIFDAYHTGSVFVHLRCTKTGAVLNVRGINMTDNPVKIQIHNHLGEAEDATPSTSIAETEILLHPGACSIMTFSLIKPESLVNVAVDLGDGTRSLAADIIFAASEAEEKGAPAITKIPFLAEKYYNHHRGGEFKEDELPIVLRHTHQLERTAVKNISVQTTPIKQKGVLEKETVQERQANGKKTTTNSTTTESEQATNGPLSPSTEGPPSNTSDPTPSPSRRPANNSDGKPADQDESESAISQLKGNSEQTPTPTKVAGPPTPAPPAVDHGIPPKDQGEKTAQALENERKRKEMKELRRLPRNFGKGSPE